MYRVLIVDDEPFVRGVLRDLVDWASLGFQAPEETYNGRKALELLGRRPFDLVVTDIKMPVMDGIDLIARAREAHPTLRFVVLSAYGEYALVRQAFRLGALDYLLKPELSEAELAAVLRKAAASLADGAVAAVRPGDGGPASAMLREWIRSGRILAAGETHGLFPGAAGRPASRFLLLSLRFRRPPGRGDDGAETAAVVDRAASALPCALACRMDRDEYCLLLGLSREADRDAVDAASRAVRGMARDPLFPAGTLLEAGASGPVTPPCAVSVPYAEAVEAGRSAFLSGGWALVEHSKVAVRRPWDPGAGVRLRRLQELLATWDPQAILAGARDLRIPPEAPAGGQAEEIRRLFDGYYAALAGFAKGPLVSPSAGLAEALALYDGTHRYAADLPRLNAWICLALRETAACVRAMGGLAARATAFLSKNYANPLDLGEIAGALGVSKGHLCRLFRQETGSSVMEYRENLRMRRAAELLRTTALMVYQVAEQVGYDSVENFSKAFKRRKGQSPARFGGRVR